MKMVENNLCGWKMFFYPVDESLSHIHGNYFNFSV